MKVCANFYIDFLSLEVGIITHQKCDASLFNEINFGLL